MRKKNRLFHKHGKKFKTKSVYVITRYAGMLGFGVRADPVKSRGKFVVFPGTRRSRFRRKRA